MNAGVSACFVVMRFWQHGAPGETATTGPEQDLTTATGGAVDAPGEAHRKVEGY